ncbi:hypothetical protein Tco_0013968 [Tanacetum coccineum]
MSTSNQQTLADSGANERPPMLEKGNSISLESRFRRFLDNKLEDGERMWNSIQNGPYKRPMIPNPDNDLQQILEPVSKMTARNKSQYITDVKEIWERIKRLMFGFEVTSHVRHSRLMDEFDKFTAKEGESLESVYDRLTTLVNIMDCNNVCPIQVSINTKFLNCLQPKWSKYVTMFCHNQTRDTVSYDVLCDSLVQFKPHVLASKAKKAANNHDPLALIAYSNASSSQSHANSSYSPQPYYVIHSSSIVDYEDEYQGELQGGSQDDKLTTAMMLLARAITKKFSTPTNNLLRTSSNTRMQGDSTEIKHLMQEPGMMKAIRLFSVFHVLASNIESNKEVRSLRILGTTGTKATRVLLKVTSLAATGSELGRTNSELAKALASWSSELTGFTSEMV